jgi:hypothetical protein
LSHPKLRTIHANVLLRLGHIIENKNQPRKVNNISNLEQM